MLAYSLLITSPAGAVAKYCNEYVCLSVYLSVREDIFGTTRAIFAKFFMHVACVRGSVLLWHIYDRPIDYRREGVFFALKCIIGRERGMGVHSAGEVCYLRLLCL